jgi:16S rRNA (guanine966-N2)-methyltransferase
MLRIVAGRFRGRRLHGPQAAGVRPTADRMKESLYNVLQGWFPGARVLDLFAGSGNLGLEALSRGASRVVLVESRRRALQLIERNLQLLGVEREVEVVAGDALGYLRAAPAAGFDLILADPPYDAGLEADTLAALSPAALAPGGCFVLQHRRSWSLRPPEGWRSFRSKRFGDTVVDFLVREEAADGGSSRPGGALPGDL